MMRSARKTFMKTQCAPAFKQCQRGPLRLGQHLHHAVRKVLVLRMAHVALPCQPRELVLLATNLSVHGDHAAHSLREDWQALSASCAGISTFVGERVQEIPERFRCKLNSYEGSRLDRGHMAPAMNHKHTQKGMNDTFFLTNISPQVCRFWLQMCASARYAEGS